ncbi:MAG: hypothetical protein ABR568_24295, partial [Pyrinomonadaceae bacterium]
MGLFWRRKGKDQFVTLGLNKPEVAQSSKDEAATSSIPSEQKRVIQEESPPQAVEPLEPEATGAGSAPVIADSRIA